MIHRLSAETSDHFVVFDTIRSSICFQKPVADGWTKVSHMFTPVYFVISEQFTLIFEVYER